jgi:polysaccharide pyruvyl transferase WcaK-like protein
MNILITNSVPLNGGDESLLRALMQILARNIPTARFTVLTNATMLARSALPDLAFDDDLEHASPNCARSALAAICGSRGSRTRRLVAELARQGLELFGGKPGRRRILELYANADAVFCSPGGYLHDYYPVNDRLAALELALHLGKPVMLVGHSLGPFWIPRSQRRARNVLNRVTRIVVRERFSVEHLRKCEVRQDHVSVAADLAFAWADLAPGLFRERTGQVRRLGLCFRRWPLHDASNARQIRDKAAALCRWLLKEPSLELVFVSTCQGIRGYVDDSQMSTEIVASLPAPLKDRCTVDRVHRSPGEMIRLLGSFDACICMRMHACILAMLGGTPAMAFDYEQKSVGVYEMMGLNEYHLDFRLGLDFWISGVERLLSDLGGIHNTLRQRIPEMSRSATDAIVQAAKTLTVPRT